MPRVRDEMRRDGCSIKMKFNNLETSEVYLYASELDGFVAVDAREVYLAHVRRELRKREKARG